MGFLEAVVVLYLRRLLGIGFADVAAAPAGPTWLALRGMELEREAATVVMILAVALLAGRGWRGRLGAFAFVFGVWDLSYYVWLALLVGWPRGLLDWDLLFLIPAPWWGPVLAPALVAVVLVAAGIRFLRQGASLAARPTGAALAALGAGAIFAAFLLAVPGHFPWALYLPALALFTAGMARW
ncbi:MAG: hypothetical protein P8Z81_10155 [Deinococcales bacterium]